jgi:acetyltransferase-like isoleucine patch superfamily enzyme
MFNDHPEPSSPAREPRLHLLLRTALAWTGKDYAADPELPSGLILSVARVRLVWLLRGVLRFRRLVFVARGVRTRGAHKLRFGRGCTLERFVAIDGYCRAGVTIGARSRLGAYTVVSCTSHLSRLGTGLSFGEDSGIGEFGYLGCSGGLAIGERVIMGQYVSFHSQEHLSPHSDQPISSQGVTEKGIVVGDDCWIGSRVTVLDGSVIGRGSIVAAGAVVRGEFPPYSVLAGVPARVVKSREEPQAEC